MENKGSAEVTDVRRPAEEDAASGARCFRRTVGEDATLMESAKDRFRQFKDAPAAEHWVCLKNKVRAASEYAGLMTRQGVSMFGEPKIGSVFQQGSEDHAKKTSPAES
ncbi:uncharacterized protein LOC124647371 [Lolium rigidum]|uniref:uncharacterized protein LOC124647371 n=1 Tax=Lolium rigidum TaxID=89674 RepID=UPI001F5C916A|nr:uncharacterized protein LOC124647371 [Lolium rigidum]